MRTAIGLGQLGLDVTLVEREEVVGGNVRILGPTFPTNIDGGTLVESFKDQMSALPSITIYTEVEVQNVQNGSKTFIIALSNDTTLTVDAIIIATGFKPFDASRMENYGYGRLVDVVNAQDFVGMVRNGVLVRPSDNKPVRSVSFIQCVGSRDKKTNIYCSSFCCTYAVHLASLVKEKDPSIDVKIFYMDMRTFSNYENLYLKARLAGVKFIRGKPSLVTEDQDNNQLLLQLENTLNRELMSDPTDLVVLSIGAEPSDGTRHLSSQLGVEVDAETGFFRVDELLDTVSIGKEGVYIVGSAGGPKDSQYSLAQADAVAMQVALDLGIQLLENE